jgi:hypothetical protein
MKLTKARARENRDRIVHTASSPFRRTSSDRLGMSVWRASKRVPIAHR